MAGDGVIGYLAAGIEIDGDETAFGRDDPIMLVGADTVDRMQAEGVTQVPRDESDASDTIVTCVRVATPCQEAWYCYGMRATIDAAGRVVIPKSLREAIGLGGGGEIEIELVDGALLVAPPTVRKRIEEHDGRATIVAEQELPPLPDQVVRDVLDAIRR